MPKLNLGRVVGDKGDPFTYNDFTPDQLDGITPKILLGNVTTLNPDENATVNMRKDGLKNYVDFGIPRGKNGSEIQSVSAQNVEMADGDTLENTMAAANERISKIEEPTFDDTVNTYTTLDESNTAAETSINAIKSKINIFTTLSNMKKSFSAIVQGLKILGTNVGAITGITSDLAGESETVAASIKAVNQLNSNLANIAYERYTVKISPGGNAVLTYNGSPLQQNHNYIIQLSTIYTSTFQYRRYLLRNNVIRIIDNIAPSNLTVNFNVPELVVIDGIAKIHFEGDKSTSIYFVGVIVEYLG